MDWYTSNITDMFYNVTKLVSNKTRMSNFLDTTLWDTTPPPLQNCAKLQVREDPSW